MTPTRRRFLTLAGAAAAAPTWPLTGLAQVPVKVPRVVLASSGVPTSAMTVGGDTNWSAILDQLAGHGFVEGRTVTFERYLVPVDKSLEGARAIVASAPDLIFWGGATVAVRAARDLTQTIPMIAYSADLVGDGLVDNAARPGKNITGVSVIAGPDYEGKLLGLLHEVAPAARRFGYVCSGSDGRLTDFNETHFQFALAGAAKVGVSLDRIFLEPGNPTRANFERAFADIAKKGIEAIQLASDTTAQNGVAIEADLAAASKVPSIAPWSAFSDAGGLLSYGPDYVQQSRQCGDYIALVLNGAKPGDLPVLQPTSFLFQVNQRAAKAIGITVPIALIIQATKVIT